MVRARGRLMNDMGYTLKDTVKLVDLYLDGEFVQQVVVLCKGCAIP